MKAKATKKTVKKSKAKATKKTVKKSKAKGATKVFTLNPNAPEITQGLPRTLNASMSVKLNTNQYESMSIGASLTIELKPDANLEQAGKEIYDYLNTQLKPKIAAVREKYGAGKSRD